MWLILANGASIETGVKYGFESASYGWMGGCNCTRYSHYWSDVAPNGSWYLHPTTQATPNGTMQGYEISRASTYGQWLVKLGGQVFGVSTVVASWNGIVAQYGGELEAPNAAYGHADTFDMLVGLTGDNNINYGNLNPVAMFYDKPYFNAISYYPGEFSWNKP